ncbi:endonuclease domain-containing protein [Devosia sp.]|uniref:endonuclease domain-containing protein n=1 Tax=Devosia sp. TaxID=1871048 RepID=UPI0035AFD594
MSTDLARKLRRSSTAPERRLWRLLYPLRSGSFHFRKQVQVGEYYVDFACLHAGLVIELDGETHASGLAQSNDATRDDYLAGRGFHVLRFSNDDVMTNPEGVFTVISTALATRPANLRAATPSPTLPAWGRVPAGGGSTFVPQAQNGTSPLSGEVGRGGASGSNLGEGTP